MHVHVFADVFLAVLNHHHRPVVHVAHTLPGLLAFLEDVDVQYFARQHHGLDRVGQLVDVQHGHALQLRHAVQVVVVRQHRALQLLSQHHQLVIHLADARHIDVADAHQYVRQLLQFVEHFHAAPPALAPQPVRGIGDVLQFVEHKARDQQRPGQEARSRNIGHAPVDDDAGVQQDGAVQVGPRRSRTALVAPAQRAEQAHDVALPHHEQRDAEVAEQDHADEGQYAAERLRQVGQRECEQRCDEQADHQPGQAREQALGREPAQQRPQGPCRARGEVRRQDQAHQRPYQRQPKRVSQNVGIALICEIVAPDAPRNCKNEHENNAQKKLRAHKSTSVCNVRDEGAE